MKKTVVRGFAKVNLTLDITGRRDDGYHFMKMILQSVGLCDELSIRLEDSDGIRLTCSRAELACNDENLAFRAAVAFYQGLRQPAKVAIHIDKNIPMQAGLAGGSADAAAVLTGLNRLHDQPFSPEQLAALGQNLGADIPFCLRGGTVLAEGIGEILTELPGLSDCYFVIAKPDAGMSTPECFSRYDKAGAHLIYDTDAAIAAIASQDLPELGKCLFNVLEPMVPIPEVAEIKRRFLRAGSLGSCMSGSGTAVIGLFDQKSKAKKAMRSVLEPASFVVLTRPVAAGCEVLD